KERKSVIQDALREHLGDIAEWTNPEGGFFLWVKLKGDAEKIDTEKLMKKALDEGVAYIPGPAFSPAKKYKNQLRLCFASNNSSRLREGVRRLAKVIREEVVEQKLFPEE